LVWSVVVHEGVVRHQVGNQVELAEQEAAAIRYLLRRLLH